MLAEAQAYLAHAVLGPRLRECARAVPALDDEPRRVFGPVDEMKLRSCLTLFSIAAPDESVFTVVIAKHYHGASGILKPSTLGGTTVRSWVSHQMTTVP